MKGNGIHSFFQRMKLTKSEIRSKFESAAWDLRRRPFQLSRLLLNHSDPFDALAASLIFHGQYEVAKVLIPKVNLNQRFRVDFGFERFAKETPLTMASVGDTPQELEIVDLILNYGADPNMPNGRGQTALERALASRSHLIAWKLLQHNAKISLGMFDVSNG